jgi:uncharacterized damage-inducible protein DinB
MIDVGYCRTMASYNAWMNQKLYALCAGLPDAERRRDRGAFFGSIHATLDHLLYGDLAWLGRFTGEPRELPRLGTPLHADFDALRREREAVDARLVAWAETLAPAWLEAPTRFVSQTDGVLRELPTWTLVVHLFNHQTHHRGQVTTLLSQLGLDVGPTDLHKLPGAELDLQAEAQARPSQRSA